MNKPEIKKYMQIHYNYPNKSQDDIITTLSLHNGNNDLYTIVKATKTEPLHIKLGIQPTYTQENEFKLNICLYHYEYLHEIYMKSLTEQLQTDITADNIIITSKQVPYTFYENLRCREHSKWSI